MAELNFSGYFSHSDKRVKPFKLNYCESYTNRKRYSSKKSKLLSLLNQRPFTSNEALRSRRNQKRKTPIKRYTEPEKFDLTLHELLNFNFWKFLNSPSSKLTRNKFGVPPRGSQHPTLWLLTLSLGKTLHDFRHQYHNWLQCLPLF